MTLVIILVVVALVLGVSGGLLVASRSRRRAPTAPQVVTGAPRPATTEQAAVAPAQEAASTLEVPAARPVLKDRLGRARGLLAGYFDQVRGRKGIDDATF